MTTTRGSGISEAEWTVMEVLWRDSPLTSREVVDRLAGETDWSPKTVKTLLGRLVRKQALGYEEHGNRYLYMPRLRRREAVRAEGRSFVERVFGGAPEAALLHFARQVDLPEGELDELRRLLKAGEGDR
jgi:BlaI family transcriptional regulator, penicillinase repressor